ncbi:uncharacterized protein LOC121967138 isoform X3 [Zingiber officinale]|uniref:uncharacterized protein LOC121967138 isoform X3 n=1 Tax=Zingiber officinale TaxID=94328 RepID=UPI001C4AC7B0|nr:uncharacterized protein LOC121967138 isoform X3 [Zingiber officinale]
MVPARSQVMFSLRIEKSREGKEMLGVAAVDHAFHSSHPFHPHHTSFFSSFLPNRLPFISSSSASHGRTLSLSRPTNSSLRANSTSVVLPEGEEDGFEIEVENVGEHKNRRRRIQSRIRVNAELDTVWSVLTDYEGLAGFIPSLAVSQLLDKKDKFARLFQVGQQDLVFGLKFNAKGVLDCYERDLKNLPNSRKRDIDFRMIEGDFEIFEGKWSIEQTDYPIGSDPQSFVDEEFQTILSYFVELVPKLWLPIRLIEGRVCKEVKTNLLCVREQAQRVQRLKGEMHDTWIWKQHPPPHLNHWTARTMKHHMYPIGTS